jgi:diguanylate cyclase (GGDEF)-like protein
LEAVSGESFRYQEMSMPVTVSIGVAELMPGETVPTWIERVDRALYRAKENGRNQIYVALETVGVSQET